MNKLQSKKITNNFLTKRIFKKKSIYLICFFLLVATQLEAANTTATTHFLNVASFDFSKILPLPPDDSSSKADFHILKDAMAARTKKQVARASTAALDDVFDYSQALGEDFNDKQLPLTSALFQEVKSDTKIAISAAKNYFHRVRPKTWQKMKDHEKSIGYAYPSGHSTRAFLWAYLLKDLFPKKHQAIMTQARQKAWNRVILGRHYPNDVYAGEIYGKYLADQFLQNPNFQKEWVIVKKEIKKLSLSSKKSSALKASNSTWSVKTLL